MPNLADLAIGIDVDSGVEAAMDDASDAVEGFEAETGRVSSFVEDHFAKIGAAAAGIGAGLEGFARSQQDTNLAFERMGRVTGEGSDKMRDMATSLQNVTFPMEDVTALMETATQRGLEGDAIAEYATFWDMVGDATGESGPALAEAGVALGQLGIAAGDEAAALDAFGFITDNTNASVESFMKFVGRAGEELGDNVPHINDMAGALEALEESGVESGRAQRLLQQELRSTDGNLVAALDNLGVSEEEYRKYADAVDGSGVAIEANAQALADSFTPMQEMSAKLENVMTKYGGLASAAGAVSAPLAGAGSAMMGVSMVAPNLVSQIGSVIGAIGGKIAALGSWAAATAAQGAKAAASMAVTAGKFVAHYAKMAVASLINAAKMAASWLIAMGPIALVIAAVVGLVTLIVKNWDTIKEWTGKAWSWVSDKVASVWRAITGFVSDGVGKVVAFAKALPGRLLDGIKALGTTVLNFIVRYHPAAILARKAVELWPKFRDWLTSMPGKILDAIGNLKAKLVDKGKDVVRGLWDGIKGMGSWLVGKITSFVTDKIPGPIAKALGIASPSTVAADLAQEVPRGMIVGMEGEAGKLQQMSERLAMAALPELGVPQVPRVGAVGTSPLAGAAGRQSTSIHVDAPRNADERAIARAVDDRMWMSGRLS